MCCGGLNLEGGVGANRANLLQRVLDARACSGGSLRGGADKMHDAFARGGSILLGLHFVSATQGEAPLGHAG